ncbi:MAG: carbohydrate ABC transporter permease [Acidimicrobiales bacterium]
MPFLAPIYWLVTGVFKPAAELVHVPPVWVPHPWVLTNLVQLFSTQGGNLLRYAENTFYISGFTVVATLASSSLAAYGFSQFEFKGRDALFWTVILTLILPSWATIVPQYQLFSWLHWIGSLKPLTLPYLAGDPFTVFLLRQYMRTVPSDYMEAARIDGAGEFRIFWRIMLPMVKPALVVAGVFAFINAYNNFFAPLVYLTTQSSYTLALGAYQFVEVHGSPDMAAIVAYTALVVAPLLIVFLVAQRQIIRGVRLTGLK